jgi:hypothetical protein
VTLEHMKIPMKHSWSQSITYSGCCSKRYYVTLWRQPWHRVLIAKAYHWYDMRIFKVPGFKAIERWQTRRHQDDDFFIPWSNEQDCRCDYLRHKQRKMLLTLEVTEEQYNNLKSHDE